MSTLDLIEQAQSEGVNFQLSTTGLQCRGPKPALAQFEALLRQQTGNIMAIVSEHSLPLHERFVVDFLRDIEANLRQVKLA